MSNTFHEKYRPKTLDRIIGQEKAVTRLQGILKTGKFPNAMLFVGPSSAGKTTLARAFVADLFGVKTLDGHPDYHESNASEERGIDDIRALLRVAKLRPRLAKKRVFMIDEAQGLTGAAADTLLKPLERPPEHTLFILGSMEPEKLKQAFKNRCSQFVLEQQSKANVTKYIKRIAKAEEMPYVEGKVLDRLAENSNGEMRTAAHLVESLQQYVSGKGSKKVTEEDVNEALSSMESVDDQLAVRILVAVYALKFKVVQKTLLDVQDGFRMINTLLRLNSFLLNQEVLGGEKHRAVWWSQQHIDLKNGVKEHSKLDDKQRLNAYAKVQQYFVNLRHMSGAFMVPETALISDACFQAIQALKT